MSNKHKLINLIRCMSNKKKKKKKVLYLNSLPLQEKKQFNCLRCGFCCIYSTPAFNKQEYKIVRDLKITRDRNVIFKKIKFNTLVSKFNSKQVFQEYAYFTEKGAETLGLRPGAIPPPCEFLDKDEEGKYSCAIYPYRPSVCRDFGVKEWDCPNNPDYLKKATK